MGSLKLNKIKFKKYKKPKSRMMMVLVLSEPPQIQISLYSLLEVGFIAFYYKYIQVCKAYGFIADGLCKGTCCLLYHATPSHPFRRLYPPPPSPPHQFRRDYPSNPKIPTIISHAYIAHKFPLSPFMLLVASF